MRDCVTHHYACDCREDKFKNIQSENEKLKAENEALRNGNKIQDIKNDEQWIKLVVENKKLIEKRDIVNKLKEEIYELLDRMPNDHKNCTVENYEKLRSEIFQKIAFHDPVAGGTFYSG